MTWSTAALWRKSTTSRAGVSSPIYNKNPSRSQLNATIHALQVAMIYRLQAAFADTNIGKSCSVYYWLAHTATMSLPPFKYHPDPIETGSIKVSDTECECCGQQRGYIYVGPVFSVEELSECICPWCIADGSAHAKFDAAFTDAAGVGGYARPLVVPNSVVEEVAFRTPGFSGWQQEHWLACCGDAAAFVGRAGRAELERQWPDAISSIQKECGMVDGADWQSYLLALDKDGSPTAYVFRCLHCGRHLGYSDCD